MSQVKEADLLWMPSDSAKQAANMTNYMAWLAQERELDFEGYQELWSWSVTKVEDFWRTIWEYFEVKASQQPSSILADRTMPGARWFEGARLNYAEQFFSRMQDERPAIIFKTEDGPLVEVSWQELEAKTRALALALRAMGVERGDRVVAYLPNIPETIVALFAVTSLGAVWSSCSPDFGSRSVLDRFQQIEPKVLLTVDGYRYNGRAFDRLQVVSELQAGLPTLEKTILVPVLGTSQEAGELSDTIPWSECLSYADNPEPLAFEQVPFDHPLWVLYSSGTTGLPKPIVQGHGGILLEHLKMAVLHLDLKAEDRFFWYTSTGWMMWNFLVGGLLAGSTIVVYDGSPGHPSLHALWDLAQNVGISYFGTSAAFIGACLQAQLQPAAQYDLHRLRALGSTGSPLSAQGFAWVYDNINHDLALESVSGGTDLCTAFVCGCRILPVYAGEIQCAALGAKVEAFDENGRAVVDEVGELVITEPMPSMPLYFWNDPDNRRYLASYFEMYPGVWRHGDWIKLTPRGGYVIYGRSDSTINRQGIRMGTSEIYQVVESIPEVVESLVIDLEMLGRESFMALFVVVKEGLELNDDLKSRIRQRIRQDISPRHVPDEIYAIQEVPYTLSGKRMEVPVRRILLGEPLEKAVNPGAMRNPNSIRFFVELAQSLPDRVSG